MNSQDKTKNLFYNTTILRIPTKKTPRIPVDKSLKILTDPIPKIPIKETPTKHITKTPRNSYSKIPKIPKRIPTKKTPWISPLKSLLKIPPITWRCREHKDLPIIIKGHSHQAGGYDASPQRCSEHQLETEQQLVLPLLAQILGPGS